MRRRFFLTDNPGAGFGSRRLVSAVVATLEAAGATVTLHVAPNVAAAQAAMTVAARSGDYDALLAAGGDGTIRLAAKAALGTDVPIGIIPLGTGNVLAHETGLPRTPEAIARLLLDGRVHRIEAGRANGELFLLMAGTGFDGYIIAGLDQRLKRRAGKLAYVWPTLRALAAEPAVLEVTIDGNSRYQAAWVVIANARHYGGRFTLAPGTGVETPGLQAVLFSGGRIERIRQLLAFSTGRLSSLAAAAGGSVAMLSCHTASVESRLPAPVQLDGDPYATTPLHIEAAGAAVALILPDPDVGGRAETCD